MFKRKYKLQWKDDKGESQETVVAWRTLLFAKRAARRLVGWPMTSDEIKIVNVKTHVIEGIYYFVG